MASRGGSWSCWRCCAPRRGPWGRRAPTGCASPRPVTTRPAPPPRACSTASAPPTPTPTSPLGDLSYGVTGQEQSWCDFVTSTGRWRLPLRAARRQPREQRHERQHQRLLRVPAQPAARPRRHLRTAVLRRRAAGRPARALRDDLAGNHLPRRSWSYAAGTPRYDWTARRHRPGPRQQDIPWVVVGMHKPCLSIGVLRLRPRRRHHQPAGLAQGRPRAQRPRAPLPADEAARARRRSAPRSARGRTTPTAWPTRTPTCGRAPAPSS